MGTSIHFQRLFAGLDPRRPTPLYEQIASCIRVAIATGELEADAPLPSVRQLASTLRVNPSTVVGAYRDLEQAGFVYARRGSGTFVSPLTPQARAEEEEVQAQQLVDGLLTEAARRGISKESLLEAFRNRVGESAHV
jgi:GntR family transcriptional regulator